MDIDGIVAGNKESPGDIFFPRHERRQSLGCNKQIDTVDGSEIPFPTTWNVQTL